jgi:hypothetical protein
MRDTLAGARGHFNPACLPRVQQEVMSPPESFSFLFPLSSLSCRASRFARKSLLVPDERERERGKKKEGGITLGCTRLLREWHHFLLHPLSERRIMRACIKWK